MIAKLVLRHVNGDEKLVTVRCAIAMQDWKHARQILIITWGDLAGEYALDVRRNKLYNFGEGGGICRKELGWSAVDDKAAWHLWHSYGVEMPKVRKAGYGLQKKKQSA